MYLDESGKARGARRTWHKGGIEDNEADDGLQKYLQYKVDVIAETWRGEVHSRGCSEATISTTRSTQLHLTFHCTSNCSVLCG